MTNVILFSVGSEVMQERGVIMKSMILAVVFVGTATLSAHGSLPGLPDIDHDAVNPTNSVLEAQREPIGAAETIETAGLWKLLKQGWCSLNGISSDIEVYVNDGEVCVYGSSSS